MASVIVLFVFIVIAVALTRRNRARFAAARAGKVADIQVGSQVMTTSGLYGTVVELLAGEIALLAVAPGVELRWALAALKPTDFGQTASGQTASEQTASGQTASGPAGRPLPGATPSFGVGLTKQSPPPTDSDEHTGSGPHAGENPTDTN